MGDTLSKRQRQSRAIRFGRILRQEREKHDLSLRHLARKIDVSSAYLSRIENGEFLPPSARVVKAIARELDANPDRLLGEAGRIPNDVEAILLKHPQAWAEFIRQAQGLDDEGIGQLADCLPASDRA